MLAKLMSNESNSQRGSSKPSATKNLLNQENSTDAMSSQRTENLNENNVRAPYNDKAAPAIDWFYRFANDEMKDSMSQCKPHAPTERERMLCLPQVLKGNRKVYPDRDTDCLNSQTDATSVDNTDDDPFSPLRVPTYPKRKRVKRKHRYKRVTHLHYRVAFIALLPQGGRYR